MSGATKRRRKRYRMTLEAVLREAVGDPVQCETELKSVGCAVRIMVAADQTQRKMITIRNAHVLGLHAAVAEFEKTAKQIGNTGPGAHTDAAMIVRFAKELSVRDLDGAASLMTAELVDPRMHRTTLIPR